MKPGETLPIGTLLLPNDYQIRRGDPVSGIILGPSKIRPDEYKVYLSNGITRDIGPRIIRDLFILCKVPRSDDKIKSWHHNPVI